MVKSMTGYGKAEVNVGVKKFTIEIRSLNSKQLDLSMKVPSLYRVLEYDLRTMVAKSMKRGKVDVYLSYESSSKSTSSVINRDLASAYIQQIKELSTLNALNIESPEANATIMATALRMPDVISTQSDDVNDDEKSAILECATLALKHIEEFREQEGTLLMTDILARINTINALKEEVVPFETARVERVRTKIKESIESLKINIDSNRLEQEMIYYSEKLDITEEKVRLTNHCNYFKEVADGEEAAGRKLGFICQEIGREINTLGSKANEANIQKIVVQMKDELEKVKEQMLNIL